MKNKIALTAVMVVTLVGQAYASSEIEMGPGPVVPERSAEHKRIQQLRDEHRARRLQREHDKAMDLGRTTTGVKPGSNVVVAPNAKPHMYNVVPAPTTQQKTGLMSTKPASTLMPGQAGGGVQQLYVIQIIPSGINAATMPSFVGYLEADAAMPGAPVKAIFKTTRYSFPSKFQTIVKPYYTIRQVPSGVQQAAGFAGYLADNTACDLPATTGLMGGKKCGVFTANPNQ